MSSKKENLKAISFSEDAIILHFSDGRKVSTPLAFYPRLLHATPKQRAKWEIIGANRGVPQLADRNHDRQRTPRPTEPAPTRSTPARKVGH